MANEVCYRTLGLDRPWSIENHTGLGGYEAWKKILAGQLTFEQVIDEVKKSRSARSRRRFPTGLKWTFMPRNAPVKSMWFAIPTSPNRAPARIAISYGSIRMPWSKGMAIAGFATGSTVGYNYMRGEFLDEPTSVSKTRSRKPTPPDC